MASGTSTKPRGKPSGRGRMVRLRVDPALTRMETKQLETRAAEDLRGVGNYVAWLVGQDLAQKPKTRRRTGARVTDRREAYDMALSLSTTDRKRLKERAPMRGLIPPLGPSGQNAY